MVDAERGVGALGERRSLRAQVEERLRLAMVAGELEPGRIYSAPKLAEQLGVSPTPVREAMMELAGEGFVEPLRHRGYRVVELDEATLAEVTEVRALLEVPAHGRAAELAAGRSLDRLRSLAEELMETASAGELERFVSADMEFHLGLLEILDNRVLLEEVRRLRRRTRLYGLRAMAEAGTLAATAREHHELLDHVEAGDRAAVESLMRRHLGHVRGVWAGRSED
ncbi:MAG: GntR family transcriptional regulator [Nesterenkonia sp.]|nr:GntR family transcriptional regulator [Nesterenkonia sp.]